MKKLYALFAALFLIVPLLFFGCGEGDAGPPGPPGQSAVPGTANIAPGFPAPPASATETAIETCDVCHGPDAQLLPMSQFHDNAVIDNVNNLQATITAVTFPATPPIQPTVTFTVTLNGAPFTGLAATATSRGLMDFAIAKLVPDNAAVAGDPSRWQSYINRAATPDGNPVPVLPGPVAQGLTADGNNNGTLVETVTPGTYTFTFTQALDNAFTFPGSGVLVGYDPALTHRVGIQFAPSAPIPTDVRENVVFNVVPNGSPVTVNRRIATTASCLECHTRSVIPPRWGFHGNNGARVEVEYCVLCHNPGSTDPESGNTVDMKVMIHKIHSGRTLPSVVAGGSYIIIGNSDSLHDYSHVGYPQDIRNCEKCHTSADAATPEGNRWMTNPSIAACGSCHDNISFVTPAPAGKVLHTGGAQANNANCTVCHPATGGLAGVTNSHAIPGQAEAAVLAFRVDNVVNSAPGQFPSVTFTVTDNTSGTPVAVNILTDPRFTVAGGASRLAVIVGWKTGEIGLGDPVIDWTNDGSGNNVGQPVSINPLAAGVATANPNGSFSVTSPVAIPLDAQGTGVAALEGHPALAGNPPIRLPVKSAFRYFSVTDTTPVPRRTVVSVVNCDQCHDQLSVHGANRTDSIEVCVICHNPNATDIGRRPYMTNPSAVGIDGKREETIDFKNMIHAIHGSGITHGAGGSPRTTAVVIYGFGGTPNDFSEVTFPGNMRKCSHCHVDPPAVGNVNPPPTWQLPLATGILAVTVNSPPILSDPDDDGNITKTAGVCSACHDSAALRQHMVSQGAHFNVRQENIVE